MTGNAPPSPPPARNRWGCALVLAILVIAVAGVGMTPFGGWVQSFFYGTGARFADAYVALDPAEANLPRNPRERERLLLANAYGDGEQPIGLPVGPRLHPVGTLARLKYETFDESGGRLDEWQVRALVPNIGGEGGPYWERACPRPCATEIEKSGGTRIYRSGTPGIAEEWVLRMPVGRAFELKPQPLQTQDILDPKPRRMGLRSVRVGERSVPRPAKILVTLVEACPAKVRAAEAVQLAFVSHSHPPIPRGFETVRWVQLDGCGRLQPFPPPPEEPRPERVAIATPPRVKPEAIVLRREPGTGHAALKADEAWLASQGMAVVVRVAGVCRYDPAADRWLSVPVPNARTNWVVAPLTEEQRREGERTLYEFPRETALFWARWHEEEEQRRNPHAVYNAVSRELRVTAGPVLCNDIAPGPAPEGRVAACVPFPDRAEARFVPDPLKTGCLP